MLCEINIKVMLILHGWVGGIENFARVVVIISNHEWQYFPIPITSGEGLYQSGSVRDPKRETC